MPPIVPPLKNIMVNLRDLRKNNRRAKIKTAKIICKDCVFNNSLYKCKMQECIDDNSGCDCKRSNVFELISPGDLRKQVADTKFFKSPIKIPLLEVR